MARVLLVLAGVLLGMQGDVAQLQGVVLDIKASLADREAAVKSLAKSKAGAHALLDLVDRNALPAELRATTSFALAAAPDADIRV